MDKEQKQEVLKHLKAIENVTNLAFKTPEMQNTSLSEKKSMIYSFEVIAGVVSDYFNLKAPKDDKNKS